MAFDRNKFKSLVHYVCWKCQRDPSVLGAVKLNKILWLADFSAYYQFGEPITGVRYVKREFGPVPSPIKPVLRELESENLIFTREAPFYKHTKTEFKVLAEADPNQFSPEERAIIDEAVRVVCEEHTARSISDWSHDHIWRAAEDGEEIPYFTIFATPGEISEDDREWARLVIEEVAS